MTISNGLSIATYDFVFIFNQVKTKSATLWTDSISQYLHVRPKLQNRVKSFCIQHYFSFSLIVWRVEGILCVSRGIRITGYVIKTLMKYGL